MNTDDNTRIADELREQHHAQLNRLRELSRDAEPFVLRNGMAKRLAFARPPALR